MIQKINSVDKEVFELQQEIKIINSELQSSEAEDELSMPF